MSQMKRHWEKMNEQDEERYQKPVLTEALLNKVFTKHYGNVMSPQSTSKVSDCIRDTRLMETVGITCPRCCNQDPNKFSFRCTSDPDVTSYVQVLGVQVACEGVTKGGGPCGRRLDLLDLVNMQDYNWTRLLIEKWIADKGIGVVAPVLNQTTVPKATTSSSPPGFKQYKVMLVVGGQNFECLITVDANTSEGEATTLAGQKYRVDIQQWRCTQGVTPLPPACKHIGPNSSTGPAAILPDSITDVVEANLKGVRDALQENMASRIWDEYHQTDSGGPRIEIPPQEYACEADKPEGTRDVDQFLREQQNKLWGME